MKPKRQSRDRPKLMILVCALVVLLFAGGGYWAYREEVLEIRAEKCAELQAVGQMKAGQIVAWRGERLANARMNATGLIRTYALDWLKSPADDARKAALESRMREFKEHVGYDNLILTTTNGAILLSVLPDLRELDAPTKALIAESISQRTALFGVFFRCEVCGKVHLDIVAPMMDDETAPVAALILRTNPDDYLYPLVEFWPLSTPSAETVLLRREGDSVVILNPLRNRPDSALSVRFDLSQTNVAAVQAALGRTGIFEGQDYLGRDVLADLRRVPNSPWFMVNKVNKGDLLTEVRYRARTILIIVLLGVISTALVALVTFNSRRTTAYQRLYEAEARYHQALDSMLEGCQIIGRDWRYLYLNETAIRHARRPKGELLGKRFTDAWPGVEKTPLFATLERVMNGGPPKNLDNEFLYPDGSKGLFQLGIQQVPEGVFILSMDITERKRTETALASSAAETRRLLEESTQSRRALLSVVEDLRQAQQSLRDSEERYRTLFDDAEDGIALAEADTGIIVDCNRALCRTVGREKDELVGQHQSILHPQESIESGVSRTFRQHREDQAGQILEEFLREKNGAMIPVEIRGTPVRVTGKTYILGVFRDISERKRAEQALRESEMKYRALVEQAPAITYTAALDEASTTLYISPQIETILGYTMAEYAEDPDTWRKIVHPEDIDRVLADLDNTQKTGQPYSAEYRMIARDGRVVWVRDQGAIVRDSAGKPLFLQGVMYDVTALKRAEEEVRNLNEELEQRVRDRTAQLEASNKELEAFSYSVSHDLRAPLRSIDGFSQHLLEEFRDRLPEEGAQDLTRVRAAAQKMSRLIDDMLSLSRLTRMEMKVGPVDLSSMAEDVISDLRRMEPARNVEAVVTPGVTVNGDERLLRQVVVNLLGNAWKFTRHREGARIELGVEEKDGGKVFFVRDNGAGFDMAYAKKLFGAFQRMHSESEFEGTGIGLAVVQRIVHRHGGEVWAESEVGKGATFFFTL